jgi:hypothetical protein
VKPRHWIVGTTLWLAACSAPSPRIEETVDTGVKAAWVVIETIAHSARFGFVLLERQGEAWRIEAYTRDGHALTRCTLSGPQLGCDKTGQVAR